MNELDKDKAINIISEIDNRLLKQRIIAFEIKKMDKKARSIKKEKQKLINKWNSESKRLQELRSKFYLIEGDKTCYGCTNDDCCIHHEIFSPRCDKYTDLPF